MNFDPTEVFQGLVVIAPPLLLAITLHEVAHGWVALLCGDKTAQRLGRLSLNPLPHVDPIGTVLVPAVLWLLPQLLGMQSSLPLLGMQSSLPFGWAKPVPVTYQYLRHPKRDMVLVAAAGPASNFLMALAWALISLIGQELQRFGVPAWLGLWLMAMGVAGVNVNVMLAVLNLVPLPPLDGSRILFGLLPARAGMVLVQLEPYGLMILLLLLSTGILQLMPIVAVIGNGILGLLF